MDGDNGPTMKPCINVPLACEPFRATKLWNDAVRAFYNGVPLSRHWRGLRQYENCFTATEAVDWLHCHLKSNPNFGPSVTKEQTIKLLRKFLKSGLIVEARGNKIYPEDFRENRELYKFGNRSPLKSLRTPRRIALAPLYSIVDVGSSPNLKNANLKLVNAKNSVSKEHQKCFKENFHNEHKDEYFKTNSTSLSNEQTDKVWMETFYKRLEEISKQLHIAGDSNIPLVSLSHIDTTYIRQNMNLVNKKVTPLVQEEKKSLLSTELPDWILSAMKCLASWPNYSESICNIPNYPGVEIDIFRVVRDYFVNLVIPLIPYELYDAVVRLYIGSEFFDIVHRSPKNSPFVTRLPNINLSNGKDRSSLTNADSVEDLLLNMSLNGNQQTSTPCLEDDDNPQHRNFNNGQLSSECRTPVSTNHNILFSAPLSLKLNKLQEYTDFKESYLYPEFNNSDSTNKSLHSKCPSALSGTESLNRRTLKALKNRSRSNSRTNSLQSENLYGNISTPPMIFDKLLKSEELDNYLLPPNSCFETAFTSDSPKTRIIPQKSVDTIHFRNSIRPKSIAVPSYGIESRSCNSLDELKNSKCMTSTYLNKINKLFSSQMNLDSSVMNKSQSEGNLNVYFGKSLCDVSGVPLSPPEHFKEGFPLSKSKQIDMASKNSFASRLRDSLKRKRMKDNCQSKKVLSRSYLKNDHSVCKASRSNSTETLISINENEISTSTKTRRLRTKSGGYYNPTTATLSGSPVDNLSSGSSVLEMRLDETNFGKVELNILRDTPIHFEHPEREKNLLMRPPSDSSSYNSDLSYQSKSLSLSVSSQLQSDASTSRFSRNCCNRPKSATPTGCLSHSLASSYNNTMYHSALSVLNQNSSSHLPDCNFLTSNEPKTPRPTLPKRAPFIKEVFNESNDIDFGLHDYQNLSDLSCISKKPLSTSASELSDSWTDRTPFGRVPPYIQGGLWKHYYSSPSLLTKIGKEVCIEALQLIFLLLEPEKRRTLHLLLRMMNKVSSNDKLQLDKETTNRALVVRTFSRSVLLSEKELDYDEVISLRILTFLMDNHEPIFSPPQHLAVLVHRKSNTSTTPVYLENQVTSSNEVPVPHKTYCQQVSPKTFEKQKLSGSQLFLFELLDQILDNPKLSDKEKRKKLHEFKVHYPEIYNKRFPPGKENAFLPPEPKKRLKGFKKFASIKSLARTKSFRV